MCDDDRFSVTSSSSNPLSEGSEYIDHTGPSEGSEYTDHAGPSDAYASPLCVCNLSVKFLLEQDRWVGNSENLYKPVGNCNSFHEEVENNYFPFLLGRPCVETGEISGSEDIDGGGVNWEYSVQIKNVQCLACAENGKYTAFKMYQSILKFEGGKDGYTTPRPSPRLAWFMDFMDFNEKYCCILWRIDEGKKAEDGAVFGIWGAGGAHNKLTFRVAAKHKSSNWIHCLQNKKAEHLIQFLKSNGVYMASKKEAERALQQQLKAFGKPQWETYERWKFPRGVSFSNSSLDATCAVCYNAPAGKCCEETFQVRKLVLKPFEHEDKEYRILAHRVDGEKFVFFSKNRDDHLRFLKMDGSYADLALRLVRNGQPLNTPTIVQYGEFHRLNSTSDTGGKRIYRRTDNGPPQKRVNMNSTSFKPINQPHSVIKVHEVLGTVGSTETPQDDGRQNQQPIQVGLFGRGAGSSGSNNHLEDSGGSREERASIGADQQGNGGGSHWTSGQHTEEQIVLPPCVPTMTKSHTVPPSSSSPSESSDPLRKQQTGPIITWELVEEGKVVNRKLELIKARMQKQLVELKRAWAEEEKRIREAIECERRKAQQEQAEIKELDTEINTLKRLLPADALANCTNNSS